jgi:primosomal protein N' (replication factor Y)
MKIVSVIPLKKMIFKVDLTYFTNLDVTVGDIVSVPIRSKQTLALVITVEELKEMKGNIKEMNFNLRKVSENKGSSIFQKEFLDTIFDTSRYFAQNANNAASALIPNIFIEKYDAIKKISSEARPSELGLASPKNQKNLRAEKLLFQYPFKDRISIYKTLIRESFARNESIFIVLPTHFDVEKFTEQLSKGIEQFTFPVHSGINAKKNLTSYEKILSSTHPVLILGTAPFLSIPKKDIGTIILEHENSSTYRMIAKPYFDLRIFVEIYATKINAKLIMADEMLRYETIGRKDIDNLNPLHPLSFRIDFDGEIQIEKKPARQSAGGETNEEKKFKIFNKTNIELIKSTVERKKSVFIFTLRKGLATMTLCKDCNETISCKKCEAPLVLYASERGKKRMFVCNRCEANVDGDTTCASCGSWNLLPLGIGTDTAYAEIEKHFSKNNENVKIFKLDKESAKSASGAKKIIEEFEKNPGSILIGTEMAFFYLKNKVPLSVIASFDSLWSIPNFKMGEKIVQIILSILNLTVEKIVIQTKNENDKIITAIASRNLLPLVREDLEDRNKLAYPPFKRFLKITFRGDKEQTTKAKKMLEEFLKEYSPSIFSGFVSRINNKYVTNALLKINTKKWSLPELSINSSIDENLLAKLLSLQPSFEVFADPEDLF